MEGSLGRQRAGHVEQRRTELVQPRERELRLGFDTDAAHHAKTRRKGGLASMIQQCSLSDARLPAHDEYPAVPGFRLGEHVGDDVALEATP